MTLTVCGGADGVQDKPAVIVLPGGGYIAPAPIEAEPVAERFAELGYLGCVLRASTLYRSFEDTAGPVNPHTVFPEPLQEVAAAIRFLRGRAGEFGIAPDKIALMGFSAGGHLAANYCNLWNSGQVMGALGLSEADVRPNADVLCYSATEMPPEYNGAMLRAAFGQRDSYDRREVEAYNARHHVSSATPPTFLWHTADDDNVSARHSYNMALALDAAGVPYELHVFSSGPHASALAEGLPAQSWPELADRFLKRYL